MLERLRARQEWQFFRVLPQADRRLAIAWWSIIVLRGALPAAFAVAMGMLVGAVQRDQSLTTPLLVVGVVFVLLQVLNPILTAVSANLATAPPPGCTTSSPGRASSRRAWVTSRTRR